MSVSFEDDVSNCINVLKRGGIILYPTDTVWGLGCDATNQAAVSKIFLLKQRAESKSLIVLVAGEQDILQYIAAPHPEAFLFLENTKKPTTVIWEGAVGLAQNVVADDGSVAIRIVSDQFCRHLVKRLQNPLVSTSANISGQPTPQNFASISPQIIEGVNYVVKHRQNEKEIATPSQIIKWNSDGTHTVIRP